VLSIICFWTGLLSLALLTAVAAAIIAACVREEVRCRQARRRLWQLIQDQLDVAQTLHDIRGLPERREVEL
jgi:hypothetical protein